MNEETSADQIALFVTRTMEAVGYPVKEHEADGMAQVAYAFMLNSGSFAVAAAREAVRSMLPMDDDRHRGVAFDSCVAALICATTAVLWPDR